ncbi:MAG: hypothetical protein ACE5H9_18475 [Anaerolineae bacterium]
MASRNSSGNDRADLAALRRPVIPVVLILLISSLGCSLARQMVPPQVLAAGPQDKTGPATTTNTPRPTFTHTPALATATRTPRPTFTPSPNSQSSAIQFTPSPTPAAPTAEATATNTPLPPATATSTPRPTDTPWPTSTFTPVRPTATPTSAYKFQVSEIYKDDTTNPFLTGYVAIVSAQGIPLGGLKVVGVFEPGGYYHESPLSKWFFEGHSAPGDVLKTSSVKFEPPGGISQGTWFLHLEDEWGARLSEDVPIATDPDRAEWFFVKFRELNSMLVSTATPTPPSKVIPTTRPASTGGRTATPTTAPAEPTEGWSFTDVQFITFQRRGVVISGNIVNNTGSSQKILGLTGTVTDSQGRVIDVEGSEASWPYAVVPSGGQTPFDLLIFGILNVADFNLGVVSQPTG